MVIFALQNPFGKRLSCQMDGDCHLGIKGVSWHFMSHVSDFHGNLTPRYFKISCHKKQCDFGVYDWQSNLRSSSPDRVRWCRWEMKKKSRHIKAQLQHGLSALTWCTCPLEHKNLLGLTKIWESLESNPLKKKEKKRSRLLWLYLYKKLSLKLLNFDSGKTKVSMLRL